MRFNIRFWLEVLALLSVICLLFAFLLTAISHGSFVNIPVAFGMIFSSFLICGGIVEVILMFIPSLRKSESEGDE